MKKISILIFAVIILALTYSYPAIKDFAGAKDVVYTYYTSGDTTGKGIWLYGDTYMISCTKSEAKTVQNNIGSLKGMSVSFKGDYDDFRKAQKNCNMSVLISENIDGTVIVYGYSDKLGKCVDVDGKTINVQMALKDGKITVGTPLIVGSY